MEFIPTTAQAETVPYFEDTNTEKGYVGQATGKSLLVLRSELSEAVGRLGGTITSIQEGTYLDAAGRKREGLRLSYLMIVGPKQYLGRIDAAALPVRRESNRPKAKAQMLYMLRDALRGLWYMQQFSPGYAALMPFLLVDDTTTITEAWKDQALRSLLPSPDAIFTVAQE